jgi:hypothetical protein
MTQKWGHHTQAFNYLLTNLRISGIKLGKTGVDF